MHRNQEYINVPIEIVRTLLAIAETGSLSKAGERLGLSQPAVSAQIKRIQNLLGGELFRKAPNGTVPTPLGKLVLNQARRMLEANDQMLLIGGIAESPQPLRLGISTLFVKEFLRHETSESLAGVNIYADHSLGIAKGLVDGYIDIGCILENSEAMTEIADPVVQERDEPFSWVRSRDFVLSQGAPIPLVTWPGDDMMVRALTRSGNIYRIVFKSPDYHATVTAIETRIGLAALPSRAIPPPLVEAKEYYLPALAPVKALLCVRRELEMFRVDKLLKRVSKAMSISLCQVQPVLRSFMNHSCRHQLHVSGAWYRCTRILDGA